VPQATVKTLKNVRMQGARERAAQYTPAGEQQSLSRQRRSRAFFKRFLFGAAGEFA
jgi:hypothetical protein